MAQNLKKLIRIDLNRFRLDVSLPQKSEFPIQFNSPSRRFYLSVIALVVHEMKKLGRITSIPLEEHLDLLALLNETVGESAGSSDRDSLLPRIYRKWKNALPNLEDAPLFKVLGKEREYGDGSGKVYPFTEEEKDVWANLFQYKGSEQHVRLRFSIDALGAGLDDVAIVYGESQEPGAGDAWGRFVADLRERAERKAELSPHKPGKGGFSGFFRRPVRATLFAAMLIVLACAGAVIMWKYYAPAPQAGIVPAGETALSLPDELSIAVLPFDNLSGNQEQEFLSDGITEEIISGLSVIPHLFVIARHSVFTYKGKQVGIQQISRDLGVRYVMEGSFERSGDRIRVTARLVDAVTGRHLWAERYDQELKDVFALQDDITMKILKALEVKLTEGEQARISGKNTANIEVYLRTLEAIKYYFRYTKDDNAVARRLCEAAISLDPMYARPYRVLAATYIMEPWYDTGTSREECLDRALELAKKALSLDGSDPCAHEVLSYIYGLKAEYGKAIAEARQAIALDPNSADSRVALGCALYMAGKPEQAIAPIRKAIRSNPIAPSHYYYHLGEAYTFTRRYEDAIAAFQKALERSPDYILAHVNLTIAYSLSGRNDEARAQAGEILRVQPGFSVEKYTKTIPACLTKPIAAALHKAGLK
jgi:TolB-like protein